MNPSEGRSPSRPLLSVRELCKHFPVYSEALVPKPIGAVRACDRITFDVMPGETFGVVGESGSGKTTLGRTLLRATNPTSGQVLFRRSESDESVVDLAAVSAAELKPLRRELQMIFQDPFASLNPRWTVQQIIGEPLVIHRLARGKELEDRVVAMMRKVGIRAEYRTRYPHAFSGGQRQRIGIARALILNPKFVVCDEAVSALDVSVQAQVINLLADLQQEFQLTYLFIAHDLSVVRHICDRVAVMRQGEIVELAATSTLFDNPQHEYTQTLLNAVLEPRFR